MIPTITVIVGVYNGEEFLRESLDSVLNQTVPVNEIVVIDDGSSDHTPGILKSYGDALRVITFPENRGLGAARREGVEAATGELISFQDADDIWVPIKNEATQKAFEGIPNLSFFFADMINFQSVTGKDDSSSFLSQKDFPGNYDYLLKKDCLYELKSRDLLADLLLNCFANIQTAVFRRSALLECGSFDTSFRRAQDVDAFYRYAATNPETAFDTRVLVRRRIHDKNLIHDTFKGDFYQAKGMARHWNYMSQQPEPLKSALITRWRTVQRQAATGAMRNGNSKQARQLLRESILRQGTAYDQLLLLSTYFPRRLRRLVGKTMQTITGKHVTMNKAI